tara:strand:+ start:115 stop:879 length:765 start_codon:yes stop_codon:yes gene_type:complete
MTHSVISLGLGLGGGKASTSSGRLAGGGALDNQYSISVDGSDDFIDCGDDSSLAPANITISLWIKVSGSISGGPRYILTKFGAHYGSIHLRYTSGGRFNFFLAFGVFGAHVQGDFPTAVTLTDWHHVALTYDGSYIKGYVDGSEDYSASESRSLYYTEDGSDGTSLVIGKGKYTPYTEGLIDEVSWFSSALSASDITAMYNDGVPTDISSLNPVSWWRMGDNDGGSGTTITDQGSGGNDGTLTNGPTFSSTVPS